MNISIESLIFLFGAVQALLLIIGINLNKPLYSDLKKITTLLLLAMMTIMVYYVVYLNKYYFILPYIDSLGTASWMAIAPLYYLLLLSIQVPKWRLTKKHLLYLTIPMIFVVEAFLTTLGFPYSVFSWATSGQMALDAWIFLFFSTSFYFALRSIILCRNLNEEEVIRNKELMWFSYVFFLILLGFAITYIGIRKNYAPLFELILVGLFEFFVFMLIYKVFKVTPFKNFFDASKYDNHILSKSQLQIFAKQLEKVMEDEKPYLDKKLSLNELAKLSKINSNDLSQLFNAYYQSSFYEFINRYRLGYLEKMILDPSNQQFKIMALAEESGFNSKATFYKVFKEKHQLTPAQFVKKFKKG